MQQLSRGLPVALVVCSVCLSVLFASPASALLISTTGQIAHWSPRPSTVPAEGGHESTDTHYFLEAQDYTLAQSLLLNTTPSGGSALQA